MLEGLEEAHWHIEWGRQCDAATATFLTINVAATAGEDLKRGVLLWEIPNLREADHRMIGQKRPDDQRLVVRPATNVPRGDLHCSERPGRSSDWVVGAAGADVGVGAEEESDWSGVEEERVGRAWAEEPFPDVVA